MSDTDRRNFLRRAGIVGAGALGAGALSGQADSANLLADGAPQNQAGADPAATLPAVPFHGTHQAGILTPRQPAGAWVAFDVTADTRQQLTDLFKAITNEVRFLTAGGVRPDPHGTFAPPTDSGTLGTDVPADGLTATLGVGASLFDHRFGLAAYRPRRLQAMTPFPNDNLDPARTGGDLLLQLCAGSQDTVLHALRQITRVTRGGMQIRWCEDGFASPARPTGVPRNHFAFKDGIANPLPDAAPQLLWAAASEPAWTRGGTYHVVRIIQMFTEFWDRVSTQEQQQMIGRNRDSGAPLDGSKETDTPHYGADPAGNVIPLTAHIRVANPRTAKTEKERIYRRGYNYDRGVDLNGNLDMGLLFNAFCQDLDRQYIAIQNRLVGEPMVDYISPVGGGYFFALPGVRDKSDHFAAGLLTLSSGAR
ncbi:MAG: Dyp-type peroxidase [Solirubrobacterales bacterium]|nr:Dyp-type peroxidase [Solirubrobacterales bacterium]